MYYVYLIRSEKSGRFYVGYTANLKERFHQHNTGKCTATKSEAPFELVYYEAYKVKEDALSREKKLKHHGQGMRRLKERLQTSIK